MERDEEEIRLVVDTNILIAALLKDDSLTARILRSNACSFYYPSFGDKLLSGIYISKRAKYIQASSFEHALQFILESVNIVPSEMYSGSIEEAFRLMERRDPRQFPMSACPPGNSPESLAPPRLRRADWS
jgi:predicted nucleic acid-binding protein